MTDRAERLRDRAVTRIKTSLKSAEAITNTTDLATIMSRLELLETHYRDFNSHEDELFAQPGYQPITGLVDEAYGKARELCLQAAAKKKPVPADTPELNTTLESFVTQQRTFYEGISSSAQARLPKITIAPFSGEYQYWPSFHDLFMTTVHDSTSLSNVHKFQILSGLVKGDAASLIRHICVTDANYTEAWDKLCKRYNKVNPIIRSHIQSFFDQKSCHQANGKKLRRIAEHADEVIRGLRALGPDAETRDPWLIYIMLSKIDNESRQLWATRSVDKKFPSFSEFIEFLNVRCDSLETYEPSTKKSATTTKPAVRSFLAASEVTSTCIICKGSHLIHKCPTLKNMPLESRHQTVIENELCRNCLRKGHISDKCYNKTCCLICHKRHHTLLHNSHLTSTISPKDPTSITNHHIHCDDPPNPNKHDITPIKPGTHIAVPEDGQKTVLHTLYSTHDTILPTAVVHVSSCTGQLQLARILLDSGSQMTFVTESCIQRLGLKRKHAAISIHGLAATPAGITKGKTDITLISRVDNHYTITLEAHIIPQIASLVPTKVHSLTNHPILTSLQLADPEFQKHNEIDILVGANVFFELLSPERQIVSGLPTLQNSKFGWLVAGTLKSDPANPTYVHAGLGTATVNTHEIDVSMLLKKFWELEEIPSQHLPNSSNDWCETHYNQRTTRETDGRFCVRLPFKRPKPQLGNSWHAAQRRLLVMERKFTVSPEFCKSYKDFMREYIELGHMSHLPWSKVPVGDDDKYFIPHHAVVKSTSSTTKLRVVFDASSQTTTSVSLNDTLQVGPNIQQDLTTIVLKFRKPIIAFVANIEKMYRQVNVDSTDANYQLILWRENPKDPISIYKLNTITYGTACAPYLAVRTLQRSTEEFQMSHPEASHAICTNFYVDDLLTGCDSLEDAKCLKNNIITILGNSGFHLRKWRSNSPEFLQSFSQQEIENTSKLIEEDPAVKTLGIVWHAVSDTFQFKVQHTDDNIVWTKRSMLSAASRVYDPLGWLAPVIIQFKIILQKIWLLKLDWDAQLPDTITKAWKNVHDNMANLTKINIPRCLTKQPNSRSIQIHAFCDASEAAYGGVIYLRAEDELGNITVNIICAKSKVAPLKQISLPRLELCGAVLVCDLVKFCIQSLNYDNITIHAWTDSMIVLHWLSDIPRRWTCFIANRTSRILDLIPRNSWAHVKSDQNPADHITRGVKPQSISTLHQWWKGPQWLANPEHSWPRAEQTTLTDEQQSLEERSRFVNAFVETPETETIMAQLAVKYSSWFKLRKIMAYVLRFGKPKSTHHIKQPGSVIHLTELRHSEMVIIRNIQQANFRTELSTIATGNSLSKNHHLSSLDPFIDDKGILRVGGRLNHSQLSYTSKHPIILPKDHPINALIIREIHVSNLHAGNSLVLAAVRQLYWMIGARYTIKRYIKTCVTCVRQRSMKIEPKMGDLPAERCTISRPFLKSGLDYAGPLVIKTSKRKNAPTEKAYIAVFVCLCVKAVHLEVVSSLETESFLAALKRFVSRRGVPEEIWCDNGATFVGADRELRRLQQQIISQHQNELISNFSLQKNIIFHHIPPRAPNFGGLWEATVKSVKHHLKRIMDVNATYEELTTVITQIESILNSRPLCGINDDPTNLQILTPGHFLIGQPLIAIPEPSLNDIPMNKLSKWQNLQRRIQGFYKCWSRDYLSTLQHRYKWKVTSQQLNIDDIVLIHDENLHSSRWILGRIINIHPGADGIVRVVTIKTAHSELKRSVNRLVKLPINTA